MIHFKEIRFKVLCVQQIELMVDGWCAMYNVKWE